MRASISLKVEKEGGEQFLAQKKLRKDTALLIIKKKIPSLRSSVGQRRSKREGGRNKRKEKGRSRRGKQREEEGKPQEEEAGELTCVWCITPNTENVFPRHFHLFPCPAQCVLWVGCPRHTLQAKLSAQK